MSHLADVDDVPVIDVWGQTVRARRIEGERITLALVELAPSSVGAANADPRRTCASTAVTTTGCAWPRMSDV